jgi:hypothetical protein
VRERCTLDRGRHVRDIPRSSRVLLIDEEPSRSCKKENLCRGRARIRQPADHDGNSMRMTSQLQSLNCRPWKARLDDIHSKRRDEATSLGSIHTSLQHSLALCTWMPGWQDQSAVILTSFRVSVLTGNMCWIPVQSAVSHNRSLERM